MRRITKLIIHCSATAGGVDIGVREIREWHTAPKPSGNGWKDIGYHWVIRRDGTVEAGRPEAHQGAHAAANNGNVASIGVCMVGGVEDSGRRAKNGSVIWSAVDNFTREQWGALRRLVREVERRYPDIDTILGHRDLDPRKACPSFSVRDWLIRERIREITWA